jgi:hypothetical protein
VLHLVRVVVEIKVMITERCDEMNHHPTQASRASAMMKLMGEMGEMARVQKESRGAQQAGEPPAGEEIRPEAAAAEEATEVRSIPPHPPQRPALRHWPARSP